MMLQGLTVQYLFNRTYKLKAGDTILFHAAAGGVGLIACQWAKAIGVNLIGTVGSEEKAALAKAAGAAHVINYNTENFTERVLEITGGKKVPVVYDSIGKDTFIGSLDCLAPLGLMVSFGNASGRVAVYHAAVAVCVRGHARRAGGGRRRPVPDGRERQGEDRRPSALQAGRRGAGGDRSRGAQDDRVVDFAAVMLFGSDPGFSVGGLTPVCRRQLNRGQTLYKQNRV
jgi:NADPH:quinone reductase-like Zn-dependent oxidoreductase